MKNITLHMDICLVVSIDHLDCLHLIKYYKLNYNQTWDDYKNLEESFALRGNTSENLYIQYFGLQMHFPVI